MLNGYAKNTGAVLALVCALQIGTMSESDAYYSAGTTKVRVKHPQQAQHTQTYWQRHPKVKSAAIGGGVGAAGGALVGGLTGHGVVRGAAIGAGTGAGVGLIRSSNTLKRHPIARDAATGTAAGLGIGWAGGRGGSRAFKGAAIGGAVGLGVGLFKNLR
jgi:Glycine-zipper domain